MQESIKIPICSGLESLKYFEFDNNVTSNTSSDLCMDTFYDRKTNKRFSVYIKCIARDLNPRVNHVSDNSLTNLSSKKESLKDIKEKPSFELNGISMNKIKDSENILRIPKCCSKGKTFDVYSKTCVDSGFDDFNLIFGQNVTFDFSTGILFCSSVQVDYTIPKENVYFEGKNDLVSFCFKKYFYNINKNFRLNNKNFKMIID